MRAYLARARARRANPTAGASPPAGGLAPGAVLECHASGTAYTAERPLGVGGFGAVWLCRESRRGEARAVKVVRTGRAEEAAAEVAMMRRGLEAGGDFHVPALYESGAASVRGQPNEVYLLIAMEYIDGVSASRLAQAAQLPGLAVAAILSDVGKTLSRLHEHGLIHRDVKGDNVMVSREGRAYLCDFGISALEEELRTRDLLDAGTPDFLAPELIGRVPQFTDKADVWAFGILAIELATGTTPIREQGLTTFEAVRDYLATAKPPEPPKPDGYPNLYGETVSMCLVRSIAQRASMDQVTQSRFVRQKGGGNGVLRDCLREYFPVRRN